MRIESWAHSAYSERLAASQAKESKPPPAAVQGPDVGAVGGSRAAPVRTIFDDIFASEWEETSRFPGINKETGQPVQPVRRNITSLVLPLALPETDAESSTQAEAKAKEAAAKVKETEEAAGIDAQAEATEEEAEACAGSFVHALSHCVCRETAGVRSWCAELNKYRQASVTKQLRSAPPALWLLMPNLPTSTMEEWQASHGGTAWMPPSFHLSLPKPTDDGSGGKGSGEAKDGDEGGAGKEGGSAEDGSSAKGASSTAAVAAGVSGLEGVERPRVSLRPPPEEPGRSIERYSLRALASFTQSLLPHASTGSGHLVLYFRVPMKQGPEVRTKVAPEQEKEGAEANNGEAGGQGETAEALGGGSAASGEETAEFAAAKEEAEKLTKELSKSLDQLSMGVSIASADGGGGVDGSSGGGGESGGAGGSSGGDVRVPCVSSREMAEGFDGNTQWFSWNDFVLRAVSEDEVFKAHSEWKRPCVALFTSTSIGGRLSHLALDPVDPVATAADLSADFSLLTPPPMMQFAPSFTPLMESEWPVKAGSLVAIDAEFVAVTREQTRTDHRGRTIVIKPARLALARVSCVRGEGDMAGVPFIDSYVQQAEPVKPYCSSCCSATPLLLFSLRSVFYPAAY